MKKQLLIIFPELFRICVSWKKISILTRAKTQNLLTILFLLLVFWCNAQTYTGKVIEVKCGDLFEMQINNTNTFIKIMYVSCPKITEKWGDEAKQFTEQLILNKTVSVTQIGDAGNNRLVCSVKIVASNEDLAWKILLNGLGRYEAVNGYANEELEFAAIVSKNSKVGIWSDDVPQSYKCSIENLFPFKFGDNRSSVINAVKASTILESNNFSNQVSSQLGRQERKTNNPKKPLVYVTNYNYVLLNLDCIHTKEKPTGSAFFCDDILYLNYVNADYDNYNSLMGDYNSLCNYLKNKYKVEIQEEKISRGEDTGKGIRLSLPNDELEKPHYIDISYLSAKYGEKTSYTLTIEYGDYNYTPMLLK